MNECPACGEPFHLRDIIDFITSPCFLGPDTDISPAQLSVLKAIYGLEMTEEEHRVFIGMTDGREPRKGGYSEASIIVGQRSGKTDKIAANIAVYEAFTFDAACLARGEWAYVMIVAQDVEGAQQARDYIEGKATLLNDRGWEFLDGGERQQRAVTGKEIRTTRRVKFKIFPCKKSSVRSKTAICCIADELAWWMTEEIAYNADREIIRALSGRRATIRGRVPLIKISSPYAEAGVLWEDWQGRHTSRQLVVNAPSWTFNPSLDQNFLDAERQKDPAMFLRDYGGQFGKIGGAWIDPQDVDRCIDKSRQPVIPPQMGVEYVGKVDVGFKHDRYVLGIGHAEGDKAVVDVLRSWKGTKKQPLVSDEIAAEVAQELRLYGLDAVLGDQYADALIAKDYERAGIRFQVETLGPEELFEGFKNFKAQLRRGQWNLPDDPLMRQDILSLQAKKSGGLFKIAAPDRAGFHDDYSNVLMVLGKKLLPAIGSIDTTAINAAAMPTRMEQAWRKQNEEEQSEFCGNILGAVY